MMKHYLLITRYSTQKKIILFLFLTFFSFFDSFGQTYCTPTATTDDATGVTRVRFNTIDVATNGNAAYTNNTATSTTVAAFSTHALQVNVNTGGNFTTFTMAWIDWNDDGDFDDAGESYDLGTATNVTNGLTSLSPVNITIPNSPGNLRMRIRSGYGSSPTSCGNHNWSEAEDYTIIVTAPPACTTPTASPTALNLTAGTPNGTIINGTFTAAAPAPNGYLVIVSTSSTPPTITNGTTYTIGGSAGIGYTVVDTDNNTAFSAGGLTPSTTYYFYIYSMNSACTGGPLYRTPGLTGTRATGATPGTYCTPTTAAGQADERYIDDVTFLGMLNGNLPNLNTGYSTTPNGYQDWTGLPTKPRQAQGGGVNISFEANSRGTWKAWVDWNKDGDFLDANEQVYDSNGIAMLTNTFGFIIPSGTPPGDYRVRIRIYNAYGNYNGPGNACDVTAYEYYADDANHFDSCTQFTSYSQGMNLGGGCGVRTVTFTEYGEAEDYLFTVVQSCAANIATVTHGEICGTGTVNLAVTGTPGVTEFRWYSAETGGTLLATTATGNWTTPSIGATTSYWVTAYNGSCESLVRTEVIAKVGPLPTISFTPSTPEICGENNVISITASGDTEIVHLIDENFESGGLGVFTNTHLVNNPAVNAQSAWQNETSTIVPGGQSWYPAISSNFGANQFVLVTSDVGGCGSGCYYEIDNVLTSPTVDSSDFLDLTLSFRMYYSRYFPDGNVTYDPIEYMQVQVSTNGGGAWTTLGGNIITDQGIGTRFATLTYNMNAYINEPNLRIRLRYYADSWCDGAAVDDIKLFGTRPLNTAFDWISALPVDAYQDLACTIPYVPLTPAVTVYVRPTLAQLEQGTYTFTASAVLSNGCSVSDDVSINNKSKVWKGTSSNDWNNANNWSPIGVPDITNCVIVPDVSATNYSNIGGVNYDAFGKTLQVLDDGDLQLRSGNTLTIEDFVEVEPTGVFHIENSGSLIQINNVANTGDITMDRNAVTNSTLDYVYWSTPVAGFVVNNITPSATRRYYWEPTVDNFGAYAGDFGNWITASGAMTTGRGYIIRGSSGISTFDGVPNNGNLSVPISRSTYQGVPYVGPTSTMVTEDDDNWNLLGNPYPSAISADAFLAANSAHLAQSVKIWTHGIDPSAAIADPFYQDFVLNYSVADYITYNAMGGTQAGFDGYIGAGQGFFVLMNDATSTNENAVFDNTMRSNTYRNDQFYRNSSTTAIEKHRIWLKLIAPSGASSDALVGYASDASNALDVKYDAISGRQKATFEIYSVINNDTYAIQGRALPFDENDIVPLGVVVPQSGIYTIALSKVDGLFETGQAIYLEDLQLGIIHDIKTAPYTFSTSNGRFENRFVLRYTTNALNENDFEVNNAVFVYTTDFINISSKKETIKEVIVHDLLGRRIYENKNVNGNELSIQSVTKSQSGLIVSVTIENGKQKTFKIIY